MRKRICVNAGWLFILTAAAACGVAGDSNELTVKMEEVSPFGVPGVAGNFVRGQWAEMSKERPAVVKAWPAFKSEKPVYGSIRFAASPAEPASGIEYHFALDESKGTGKGCDRLYFDRNRDLDLTNDKPLEPMKRPPGGALVGYQGVKQQVCFDYMYIDFDLGSGGKRPLEIMPRLLVPDAGDSMMSFVATKIRKGRIEIAGHGLDAFLGYEYMVGGPLDRPITALYLVGSDGNAPSWLGAGVLMAMHRIDRTLYRFSATPTGDRLTARPYTGDLGTFEIGPGGRAIEKAEAGGSLRSEEIAVAVGEELDSGAGPQTVRTCRLPVGDYLPSYLTINFGGLRITASDNYHSDGQPRVRGNRDKVYAIKIQKDRPFVLDFANKPDVMFALPAKNHRVRAGERFEAKAVLIDPQLDIMIRGLWDTSDQRAGMRSLDPTVTVTRLDGAKVAEGVMPFG